MRPDFAIPFPARGSDQVDGKNGGSSTRAGRSPERTKPCVSECDGEDRSAAFDELDADGLSWRSGISSSGTPALNQRRDRARTSPSQTRPFRGPPVRPDTARSTSAQRSPSWPSSPHLPSGPRRHGPGAAPKRRADGCPRVGVVPATRASLTNCSYGLDSRPRPGAIAAAGSSPWSPPHGKSCGRPQSENRTEMVVGPQVRSLVGAVVGRRGTPGARRVAQVGVAEGAGGGTSGCPSRSSSIAGDRDRGSGADGASATAGAAVAALEVERRTGVPAADDGRGRRGPGVSVERRPDRGAVQRSEAGAGAALSAGLPTRSGTTMRFEEPRRRRWGRGDGMTEALVPAAEPAVVTGGRGEIVVPQVIVERGGLGPDRETAPGRHSHARRLARRQPGPPREPRRGRPGAEARRHQGRDAGPLAGGGEEGTPPGGGGP